MSLTVEQTDTAIRNTFYNMEEGVEYVLNDYWFAETNRLRKEYNYSLLKDRQEYKFTRKGDQLFVNNNPVFNFDGKSNLAFALALALAFALALALAFAFAEHRAQYSPADEVGIAGHGWSAGAIASAA